MSSDDMFSLPAPKLAVDKNFIRSHQIRKLEQKIVVLVSIFFSCKTAEARQETIDSLRAANDALAELEVIDV